MTFLRTSVLIFGLGVSVFPREHCSLLVKVISPQGAEVEADVVVEERDGRKIEQENKPGGVKFCDLGITPVTVTVGNAACNQVVVRNVPLRWGEPRTVSVIYDDQPCLTDSLPVAACQFLFRFIDSHRNSIKGASLKIQTPYEEVYKADAFGRLLIRIGAGQDLLGIASANGYNSTEVRTPCVTKNRRVEQYVTLAEVDR